MISHGPRLNTPRRIFGPCRSWRMASGRSSSPRTFFTAAITARRSSSVPCEKLIRETSTPRSARARIISSEFVAGPSVTTTLVRFTFMLSGSVATTLVRFTFMLSGTYSSIVRAQTVYLQYMIAQRCLAQMERAPNECPGPGSGAPQHFDSNVLPRYDEDVSIKV